MLICGIVNPEPVSEEGYKGVYLSVADNVEAKAAGLKGTPLRVEHNHATHVGQVLQGWVDKGSGKMWALAEMDVRSVPGAIAAAAVERGAFGEFSLGYDARIRRNPDTKRLEASDKQIRELSLVRTGARPGCQIVAHDGPAPKKARVDTSTT